ncbi:MAG: xanthine dehydrogenase family protein molybdopterin-binding subunit [Chloroflexi bacterium]|nr:xanthine dehydrogenase family protein molybdopterin-binding subunit [Chloroflexota bacterium]
MTSNIVLKQTERDYKVIGTRPVRHDGVDKVTGKALYGADIHLPGMLYGKVLRSPHAHARIKRIDTSKAEAHPAVRAVATSKDLVSVEDRIEEVGEDVYTSLKYIRDNFFATDKVLYKGHPVAAVAATNPHVAEEALKLIEVEYEALPSVTNVEDAMKPDAPILHEHLKAPGMSGDTASHTNIASHQQYVLGNVEEGFKKADVVIEREFRTKTVHQGYIEPQNGTAWWTGDGRVTIWCSSQGHFGIRDRVASVLGVPVSRVKVVPMEIGGGFGGKLSAYLEPAAAVLSRKSGHPVKLTMSRAEVLEATGPTSGAYVRVKMGATSEGKIVAAQAYLAFEAGAYPGSPIGGATACMLSSYNIENALLDGYDVVDNKPKTAAYRAPGAPIGTFGVEVVVDELAEKLGIEPMEFRMMNAAREGTRRVDGTVNSRIGAEAIMQAVRNHDHYKAPLKGENRGRGVALGFWRNNTGPSSVFASVEPDGTVMLVEGSVDIGGSRTAVAQQFAEVLGIPVQDVTPQVADTDTIGYTSNTGGSGVAFKTGWAAYEAAQDVKLQLIERAARIWETSPDEVEYRDAALYHKSDPELRMTFKEIARRLNETGGPIAGRASVNPRGVGPAYAANIVDVEVDPETGKVEILRFTSFQDAGTAIHPSYVEGQMQGGAVQGIGWALNEEYYMDDKGVMRNSTLLDYRMPTSLDVPMIDTVIVEVPNPGHPFGVRGVGESPIVPPLAAIANAIHDATGVRLYNLPMNPAAIVKALLEKNGSK